MSQVSESDLLSQVQIYHALLDAAIDAIIVIDERGIIRSASRATLQLFGYTSEELLGQNVSLLMPQPHRAQHDHYLHRYKSSGDPHVLGIGREVQAQRKDGSLFPMRLSLGQAQAENDPLFVGICHDMSDYNQTLKRAETAEKRYLNILENQRELVCRLDRDLNITFANTALARLLNTTPDDAVGRSFGRLFDNSAHICDQLVALINNVDNRDPKLEFTGHLIGRSHSRYIDWNFNLIEADDYHEAEIQAVGIDMTEREEAVLTAQFLQHHDPLTRLLNTKSLISGFQCWKKAEARYAIIYLDYNHLQIISHMLDHDTTDSLILDASRRLSLCIRGDSLLARVNMSDFVVIVPVNHLESAENFTTQIIEQLQRPYDVSGEIIRSKVSAGLCLYPDDGTDISKLISLAESAIIQSNSDSPVSIYNAEIHSELRQRVRIEQKLQRAIIEDTLEIYLQPKVHLITGEIVGFEALLRWFDEGQFIPPSEFIPIAENMGLGTELDRHVLYKVMQSLSTCQKSGGPCRPIAVNITAKHFNDMNLYQYVSSLVETFEIRPGDLELEITESVILGITPTVAKTLATLRDLGIRISIDDFGTGYSSLSYLKDLTVDALKIDKSFVDQATEERGLQIVSAIVSIAKTLKLDVIAEGIETQEQKALLEGIGCHLGQGYLFAKPEPFALAMSRLSAPGVWP